MSSIPFIIEKIYKPRQVDMGFAQTLLDLGGWPSTNTDLFLIVFILFFAKFLINNLPFWYIFSVYINFSFQFKLIPSLSFIFLNCFFFIFFK
jgi:hypothetical protein